MNRLVIVGAGGHGKVIAESASKLQKFSEVVFIDDKFPSLQTNGDWPVVNSIDAYLSERLPEDQVIVAIGHNATREAIQRKFLAAGVNITTIIDASAVVSEYSELGIGCFVAPNATINIDSKLGDGVIINTAASIDHDNVIESFVHVAPGCHLAGAVTVKHGAFIGIGCSVVPSVEIGKDAVIGAGAVVIKNIADGQLAFGNPAKTRRS